MCKGLECIEKSQSCVQTQSEEIQGEFKGTPYYPTPPTIQGIGETLVDGKESLSRVKHRT